MSRRSRVVRSSGEMLLRSWCVARVCLWVLSGLGIASPLVAQVGSGTLAGDVVDQAGAGVPGATVTLVALGTNLARTVVTDRNGGYSFPSTAPGAYRVRVEVGGFRLLTREG